MDDKEDNCGGARVTGTDLTNVRITEIIDEQQAEKVGYAHVRRMLGEAAAGWGGRGRRVGGPQVGRWARWPRVGAAGDVSRT